MATPTTDNEAALWLLWDKASNALNYAALDELRTAFEMQALDEDTECALATGRARHLMGSRYYTKTGKRRTTEGREIQEHTGCFKIDRDAAQYDTDELAAGVSAARQWQASEWGRRSGRSRSVARLLESALLRELAHRNRIARGAN